MQSRILTVKVTDFGLLDRFDDVFRNESHGMVYAGSRHGTLAVIEAATGKLVFTCSMGSSEVNGFDVDPATGDIYCSLIGGTIWRISRQ